MINPDYMAGIVSWTFGSPWYTKFLRGIILSLTPHFVQYVTGDEARAVKA
jgi:hypothetical protein